ncbi:MAG: hypothetical protein CR996_00635 [Draconibacterium sp.]|nr:MAG: hypothetical protein CR996_00635 [Draconibacterium sp.]
MIKKLKTRIKKYSEVFYWIFVFIVTAVLLFFVLPGEPKFKYEYQKGMPWRHDNLVAPYDFAILKTPSELEFEKAEQLKNVVPYFNYDTTVYGTHLAKLKADLNLTSDSSDARKAAAFNLIKNKLHEVYQQGILLRSANTYDELKNKTEIGKKTGQNVKKVKISDLYSEKTAYNVLNKAFGEAAKIGPGIKNWLQPISPEKYITTNLEYDKSTTDKAVETALSEILPSRGMIQLGERIILQGEIVDADRFQLLESLKASYTNEKGKDFTLYSLAVGKAVLILSLLALVFTFLYIYRLDLLRQYRKLAFLMLFMTAMVAIASYINTFPNLHIYLFPLAILPIVVRSFFDSRTAIFILIIATLLIGLYAPNNYEFILLEVTAGVVAVFSLNKMNRRVHLVIASLWVLLTYFIVFAAINLIREGSTFSFSFDMFKWFILSSFFILLVYPLEYIFEKLFGFISDVTLIEISNSNQPLKIGGNPFLVRAGAMYHDIGKIAKPNFFIENQAAGLNPHDDISYIKSAEIIIDHVKNGVKMAQKHKLPNAIIEFIATHHGTTKANYFFIKHKQENPDTNIDEKTFIYPGPLPRTKEAAVVMLVDGIEAASRSLPEKTYDKLKDLIENMIDDKIKLKQLDQSSLTFNDINIVKDILLEKLINIYHVRIEYPKEEN